MQLFLWFSIQNLGFEAQKMIKKIQQHKQRSRETDGAVMGEIERERHKESDGSVFRSECLGIDSRSMPVVVYARI